MLTRYGKLGGVSIHAVFLSECTVIKAATYWILSYFFSVLTAGALLYSSLIHLTSSYVAGTYRCKWTCPPPYWRSASKAEYTWTSFIIWNTFAAVFFAYWQIYNHLLYPKCLRLPSVTKSSLKLCAVSVFFCYWALYIHHHGCNLLG